MDMNIIAAPFVLLIYGVFLIIPLLILYFIIKLAIKHAITELRKEDKI